MTQITRLKYLLAQIFETNHFFSDLEFIKFDLDLICMLYRFDLDLICKPADLICDLKKKANQLLVLFLVLKPRE